MVGIQFLKAKPSTQCIILERGLIPTGASTKNLGIICVCDPPTCIQELLNKDPQISQDCYDEIVLRYKGLQYYYDNYNANSIDLEQCGSNFIYFPEQQYILKNIDELNKRLYPIFNSNAFIVDPNIKNYGFNENKIKFVVKNPFEAYLNSGKLIKESIKQFRLLGGLYVTGAEFIQYIRRIEDENIIEVIVHQQKDFKYFSKKDNTKNPQNFQKYSLKTQNLFFCTNGFTKNIVPQFDADVAPGKGQVLVTKPITNLKINGIFTCLDDFYYFRSYKNRILFGGGYRLDFDNKDAYQLKNSNKVINHLIKMMKEVFFPDVNFEIDLVWSGIMGFGYRDVHDEWPIIKKYEKGVFYAVKFCGNGLSIAPYVGYQAVQLIDKDSINKINSSKL